MKQGFFKKGLFIRAIAFSIIVSFVLTSGLSSSYLSSALASDTLRTSSASRTSVQRTIAAELLRSRGFARGVQPRTLREAPEDFTAQVTTMTAAGLTALDLRGAALGVTDRGEIARIKEEGDTTAKEIYTDIANTTNTILIVHVSEGFGRDRVAGSFQANDLVVPDALMLTEELSNINKAVKAGRSSYTSRVGIEYRIEHAIIDVIEGTNKFVTNADGLELDELAESESGATSIIVTGSGVANLGNCPDIYADLIVTGVPAAKRKEFIGKNALDPELIASNPSKIEGVLQRIADANGIKIKDLEVVLMERTREAARLTVLRELQKKHKGLDVVIIKDGTVAHGLLATFGRKEGKHKVLMTVGGSPEGFFNLAVAGIFKEEGALASMRLYSKNVNRTAEGAEARNLDTRYAFDKDEKEELIRLRPNDAEDIIGGNRLFTQEDVVGNVEGAVSFITNNGVFRVEGVKELEGGGFQETVLRVGTISGKPSVWFENRVIPKENTSTVLTRLPGLRGADKGYLTSFEHGEMNAFLARIGAQDEKYRMDTLKDESGFGKEIRIQAVPGMEEEMLKKTGYHIRGHYAIRPDENGVTYIYVDKETVKGGFGPLVKHELEELLAIRKFAKDKGWTLDYLVDWLDNTGDRAEVRAILDEIHRGATQLRKGKGVEELVPDGVDPLQRPVRGAAGIASELGELDKRDIQEAITQVVAERTKRYIRAIGASGTADLIRPFVQGFKFAPGHDVYEILRKNGKALPAINVVAYNQIEGNIRAAMDENAALILEVARSQLDYALDENQVVRYVSEIVERTSCTIPIVVHGDHIQYTEALFNQRAILKAEYEKVHGQGTFTEDMKIDDIDVSILEAVQAVLKANAEKERQVIAAINERLIKAGPLVAKGSAKKGFTSIAIDASTIFDQVAFDAVLEYYANHGTAEQKLVIGLERGFALPLEFGVPFLKLDPKTPEAQARLNEMKGKIAHDMDIRGRSEDEINARMKEVEAAFGILVTEAEKNNLQPEDVIAAYDKIMQEIAEATIAGMIPKHISDLMSEKQRLLLLPTSNAEETAFQLRNIDKLLQRYRPDLVNRLGKEIEVGHVDAKVPNPRRGGKMEAKMTHPMAVRVMGNYIKAQGLYFDVIATNNGSGHGTDFDTTTLTPVSQVGKISPYLTADLNAEAAKFDASIAQHGTSGSDDDELTELARVGVIKFNIATIYQQIMLNIFSLVDDGLRGEHLLGVVNADMDALIAGLHADAREKMMQMAAEIERDPSKAQIQEGDSLFTQILKRTHAWGVKKNKIKEGAVATSAATTYAKEGKRAFRETDRQFRGLDVLDRWGEKLALFVAAYPEDTDSAVPSNVREIHIKTDGKVYAVVINHESFLKMSPDGIMALQNIVEQLGEGNIKFILHIAKDEIGGKKIKDMTPEELARILDEDFRKINEINGGYTRLSRQMFAAVVVGTNPEDVAKQVQDKVGAGIYEVIGPQDYAAKFTGVIRVILGQAKAGQLTLTSKAINLGLRLMTFPDVSKMTNTDLQKLDALFSVDESGNFHVASADVVASMSRSAEDYNKQAEAEVRI
jgi:fructose/tagatose bisphosphate aldolase/fructose-1,6-bisphosphatase/sedoheptulose 1,7-bisphosphatase-like protein